MDIAEKLEKLSEIKEDIKQALIDKGQDPTDEFDTYAQCIQDIETGGQEDENVLIITPDMTTDDIDLKYNNQKVIIIQDGCTEMLYDNFTEDVHTMILPKSVTRLGGTDSLHGIVYYTGTCLLFQNITSGLYWSAYLKYCRANKVICSDMIIYNNGMFGPKNTPGVATGWLFGYNDCTCDRYDTYLVLKFTGQRNSVHVVESYSISYPIIYSNNSIIQTVEDGAIEIYIHNNIPIQCILNAFNYMNEKGCATLYVKNRSYTVLCLSSSDDVDYYGWKNVVWFDNKTYDIITGSVDH